jgi:hypothetical protein
MLEAWLYLNMFLFLFLADFPLPRLLDTNSVGISVLTSKSHLSVFRFSAHAMGLKVYATGGKPEFSK